jgi:hypothetical protein
MTKDIYTIPFTYHIAWSNIDKHYYGVRYAKGCNPNTFWKTYFTSSKLVMEYRQKYGEPDVIEIRRIFNDVNRAIIWEHKVLRRLNVLNSKKWLNQSIGGKDFGLKEHTLEAKRKLSHAHKGKILSPEHKAKLSVAKKGRAAHNKGKKHSDKSKIKMSIVKRGKNHPMYGKTPSLETRSKISAALKGKNNPMYGKVPHNKGKSSLKRKIKEISN